ncbi:uncharacterized protein LOC101862640 [Aplysia californica]|uniref:Uncharacterized protein LOC101862640 n=1 Tax=Aplysia californica TaxID=6500 RepID=A0ABM0JL58_APLCA|nr:uncharacterized protein LOC101862640 [Aplysia californica]XP_035825073.1 uncharacterized protein LOC101862640 [Aplysia californica]
MPGANMFYIIVNVVKWLAFGFLKCVFSLAAFCISFLIGFLWKMLPLCVLLCLIGNYFYQQSKKKLIEQEKQKVQRFMFRLLRCTKSLYEGLNLNSHIATPILIEFLVPESDGYVATSWHSVSDGVSKYRVCGVLYKHKGTMNVYLGVDKEIEASLLHWPPSLAWKVSINGVQFGQRLSKHYQWHEDLQLHLSVYDAILVFGKGKGSPKKITWSVYIGKANASIDTDYVQSLSRRVCHDCKAWKEEINSTLHTNSKFLSVPVNTISEWKKCSTALTGLSCKAKEQLCEDPTDQELIVMENIDCDLFKEEHCDMYSSYQDLQPRGGSLYKVRGRIMCNESPGVLIFSVCVNASKHLNVSDLLWPVKLDWEVILVTGDSKHIIGSKCSLFQKPTKDHDSVLCSEEDMRVSLNEDDARFVDVRWLTVQWRVRPTSGVFCVKTKDISACLKDIETCFRAAFECGDQRLRSDETLRKTPRPHLGSLRRSARTTSAPPILQHSNWILLLLGGAQAGVSSVGNGILQEDVFTTHEEDEGGLVGEPRALEATRYSQVLNGHVTVVDVPGLKVHTTDFGGTVSARYERSLKAGFDKCEGGFHALIYTLPFSTRLSDEDKTIISYIKGLLGSSVFKDFGVIVITKDNLNSNYRKDKSFKRWCQERQGSLLEFFQECNFRCVLADKTTRAATPASTLFKNVMEYVMDLQAVEKRYNMRSLHGGNSVHSDLLRKFSDMILRYHSVKLMRRNNEQKNEFQELKRVAEDLNNEARSLHNMTSQLRTVVKAIDNFTEILDNEISRLDDNSVKDAARIQDMEKELSMYVELVTGHVAENSKLQEQIAAANEKVTYLTDKAVESRHQLEQVEAERDRLAEENRSLLREIETLKDINCKDLRMSSDVSEMLCEYAFLEDFGTFVIVIVLTLTPFGRLVF